MVLRIRAAWAGPLGLGIHGRAATGLQHPQGSRRQHIRAGRGAAPDSQQHFPAGHQHVAIRLAAAARDGGQEDHDAHQQNHRGVGVGRHVIP
jgi:hypothetical protein